MLIIFQLGNPIFSDKFDDCSNSQVHGWLHSALVKDSEKAYRGNLNVLACQNLKPKTSF